MRAKSKQKKKAKIRYAEYYNMQDVLDNLYAKSQSGKIFNNLMPLISSEENIKLAFRTLKRTKAAERQVQTTEQ